MCKIKKKCNDTIKMALHKFFKSLFFLSFLQHLFLRSLHRIFLNPKDSYIYRKMNIPINIRPRSGRTWNDNLHLFKLKYFCNSERFVVILYYINGQNKNNQ